MILAGRIPFIIVIFVLCASVRAQTVAVLAPDQNGPSPVTAVDVGSRLVGGSLNVLDADLVRAAFNSAKPGSPFNMSATEARRLGSAIGCNFILLIKAADLRRSSLERSSYWESYAAVYLISSRTGHMLFWMLKTAEADTAGAARMKLSEQFDEVAQQLKNEIQTTKPVENASSRLSMKTPEDFAGRKAFRAPIPFNRIKPEYTRTAYLYSVEGTVDIEVDIDERGFITNTDITRWLGFGLDESVEKAVRDMNWRPAEVDGKPLAMRVLLRYNFKKIEKD